jgi:uncharacterized protein YegP (UPF0339 family)
MAATFHINEIASGQFTYCLTAANGRVLVSSGVYSSEQDARDGITALRAAVDEADPTNTLLNMM